MPRIRCNHSVCVSATKCICSIVGKSNEKHHVFVATIDDALRTACRKVAGTPIITFSQQSLLLERPSDVSRAHATLGEEKKRAPTGKETHALNVSISGDAGFPRKYPAYTLLQWCRLNAALRVVLLNDQWREAPRPFVSSEDEKEKHMLQTHSPSRSARIIGGKPLARRPSQSMR